MIGNLHGVHDRTGDRHPAVFVLFKGEPRTPYTPGTNGSGTSSWEDLSDTGRVKIGGEDEETMRLSEKEGIARRLRTRFQAQKSWKLDGGAIHGTSFVRRWPKLLRHGRG